MRLSEAIVLAGKQAGRRHCMVQLPWLMLSQCAGCAGTSDSGGWEAEHTEMSVAFIANRAQPLVTWCGKRAVRVNCFARQQNAPCKHGRTHWTDDAGCLLPCAAAAALDKNRCLQQPELWTNPNLKGSWHECTAPYKQQGPRVAGNATGGGQGGSRSWALTLHETLTPPLPLPLPPPLPPPRPRPPRPGLRSRGCGP